jgi:sortase A
MKRNVFAFTFIILGVGFLFYPWVQKEMFDAKQKKLIEAFELLGKYDNSSELSNSLTKNEINSLDGAIGTIKIPKINLKMLIFKGSHADSLNKGVGMIEPNKKLGVQNIGLAGHRSSVYGKRFNRLNELAPNDEIEIRTKSTIYTFAVDRTFIVPRTEVGVLSDKKVPYVTLVTCTPIGKRNPPDRLIVQAKLKNKSTNY